MIQNVRIWISALGANYLLESMILIVSKSVDFIDETRIGITGGQLNFEKKSGNSSKMMLLRVLSAFTPSQIFFLPSENAGSKTLPLHAMA